MGFAVCPVAVADPAWSFESIENSSIFFIQKFYMTFVGEFYIQ